MTPLQQAVDRLAFVTQYLRDELFLAGPSGRVSLSALSMQRVYEDLAATLATLRTLAPAVAATAGQPPPGAGGVPAPPASGGG